MTGRILQFLGVIVGIVGTILSIVFGVRLMNAYGVPYDTGVAVLVGGLFGSIITALLFYAIGTTLVKVTNIEETVDAMYNTNKKLSAINQGFDGVKSNININDSLDSKEDKNSPTAKRIVDDIYSGIQNDDKVEYVTVYCPHCLKELKIAKKYYYSGTKYYCPTCNIALILKKDK